MRYPNSRHSRQRLAEVGSPVGITLGSVDAGIPPDDVVARIDFAVMVVVAGEGRRCTEADIDPLNEASVDDVYQSIEELSVNVAGLSTFAAGIKSIAAPNVPVPPNWLMNKLPFLSSAISRAVLIEVLRLIVLTTL